MIMGLHEKIIDKPIELVYIDIDGCLTSNSIGGLLDLKTLHELQELNKHAKSDPMIPEFAFMTGRYLNFVETFAQILGVYRYSVIEMGNAIFKLEGANSIVKLHPNLSEERVDEIFDLQKKFLKEYPQYQGYLQLYKHFMITFIFSNDDPIIPQCAQDFRTFMIQNGKEYEVDVGHNFINIMVSGITKGSGLQFLVDTESHFSMKSIAGIGDSKSDWDFLKLCKLSACPSNGSKHLKKKCDIVASQDGAKGTLEIIHKIIEMNKSL